MKKYFALCAIVSFITFEAKTLTLTNRTDKNFNKALVAFTNGRGAGLFDFHKESAIEGGTKVINFKFDNNELKEIREWIRSGKKVGIICALSARDKAQEIIYWTDILEDFDNFINNGRVSFQPITSHVKNLRLSSPN